MQRLEAEGGGNKRKTLDLSNQLLGLAIPAWVKFEEPLKRKSGTVNPSLRFITDNAMHINCLGAHPKQSRRTAAEGKR